MESGGNFGCRSTGWVKQVKAGVLPFALLGVSFERAVPPPGTPLIDAKGQVVAIVFQANGSGNAGYAIPAEAVHRVNRDLSNGGKLVRGWLGLGLRSDVREPEITSVVAGSPAEDAGIRVGDRITAIGSREVRDYADAANAFFYLIPDQPVKVRLHRDQVKLELTLTPTKPRP